MIPKKIVFAVWIMCTTVLVSSEQESRERYQPQPKSRQASKESVQPPPPPPPSPPLIRPTTEEPAVTSIPLTTPTIDNKAQCPCVKKPGSDTCIIYDQKYQAATVEEAIVNFPDLTSRKLGTDNDLLTKKVIISQSISSGHGIDGNKNESTSIPLDPIGTTTNPNEICKDEECKACSNVLLPQLQANGLLDPTEVDTVKKNLGIATSSATDCSKYNVQLQRKVVANSKLLSRRPIKTTPSVKGATTTSKNSAFINNLSINGLSLWNTSHAVVDDVPQRPEIRLRRQLLTLNTSIGVGAASASKIIGTRHKIGCIKRGDAMEKNSDWVSLCDACWVWRKLPAEYFPTYINELICDTDVKCLSGWGSCQQQFRNVDILKNMNTDGKDDWQAVTLESSNYCECAVKTGSALHNFVTA